uniref:Uncharacterized protein n=1 Tax=Strigamia maritima TaxID=126957 RepID=T1IUY9_STRMM
MMTHAQSSKKTCMDFNCGTKN